MNIEDYLHLYLGCKFLYSNNPLPFTLKGFQPNKSRHNNPGDEYQLICIDADGQWDEMPLDYHFKPILRPLSDMTEEENNDADEFESKLSPHISEQMMMAEGIRFLLSKHFDLFGLIEAGLAIDATTMPNRITEPRSE